MYHDEFEVRAARIKSNDDIDLPALPLVFGGGLSLSLAASLNPVISSVLLGIGGLLPLVASSFAIAVQKGAEFLVRFSAPTNPIDRARPRAPHFAMINSSTKVRVNHGRTPNQSAPRWFEDK